MIILTRVYFSSVIFVFSMGVYMKGMVIAGYCFNSSNINLLQYFSLALEDQPPVDSDLINFDTE